MNLKTIEDQMLIQKTETLVREERELLASVLHHLREIERRRLFSGLGYKSLFEFAVKKLLYSEDQAYRRIAAMRLLKELPEIDHILPRALGGSSDEENLRLLCKNCNQRAAIEIFGAQKMERHIERQRH